MTHPPPQQDVPTPRVDAVVIHCGGHKYTDKDGSRYTTYAVIDARIARTLERELSTATARIAEVEEQLREVQQRWTEYSLPRPGLIAGDLAHSTDPSNARMIFVRHIDGINWTSCAMMTEMTWSMLMQMNRD